jgi:hypothetical protein
MDRQSERGKIRVLSTLAPLRDIFRLSDLAGLLALDDAPLSGHVLVMALSRTRTSGKKGKKAATRMVEVTDRYSITSLMSPAECISLVCSADEGCYRGTGSERRVRSIAYCAPAPRLVSIQDSGFSGFNRYPLPDESTAHRIWQTAETAFLKRAA